MHTLVINQFFWPDTAPTGALLTDVARSLQANVTAICGPPDYADIDSPTPPPPARIVQTRSTQFARSRFGRVMSYATFFTGALWKAARIEAPELVLTLSTPPLASLIGTAIKSLRVTRPATVHIRHIIWEMDLYPEIAVDLGVLQPESTLTRTLAGLSRWSASRADAIIALGEDMKARLLARGIPEHKIYVAENWADGREITPQPFPEGPLTVHYSGNLGLAHDTATISAAIRHLANDARIRFIFAGGGSQRRLLPASPNVELRPYAPRAELSASLAQGHLGLVTQLPQTCGAIVPSKTYGIMAAGRPVLYIGPKAATPARIIDKHSCGWQIDPGDTATVIQLLERLHSNRAAIHESGARARAAFDQNYDKPQGVARILKILNSSAPSAPSAVTS